MRLRNKDKSNPPLPPLEKGGKACPELVEGGGFEWPFAGISVQSFLKDNYHSCNMFSDF